MTNVFAPLYFCGKGEKMRKIAMIKRPFRVFIFFLLSLMIGCQARSSQIVREPLKSPTNTAVAASTQTLTEPPPTPTTTITPISSPSPSPSSTPETSGVQKDCYSLLPSFPQSTKLHGMLLLGYQSRKEIRDWESGNTTQFDPQNEFSEIEVSPDRIKIAYHDTQNSQVVVMTEDNKILRRIPWEKNWITLSRWQNNETLLIVTKELLKSDAPNPPNVLSMLDTGTGQSRKMIPDYPDIVQGYTLPWLSGHTVYDPTLTRVVYAQTTGENENYAENYALWDIPGKRQLIALKADIREEPVWSPDGATFIVFGANGLSLVSRDGIILDTIDLQKIIYRGSDAPPVRDFSYSPDGKRVAFWVQVNASIGKAGFFHLMILDTSSGKIVDTCFEQEDHDPGFRWERPRLVWSPDGDQLAAPVNYRANDDTWDVVIADVEQKFAVKIAEKLFPIGWLVKAP